MLENLKNSWGTVRWRMLVIFAFFSIASMFLVACFSVAVLNVVIRRESASFVQEQIDGIVENCKRLAPSLLNRVQGCQAPVSTSPLFAEYPSALWPGGHSVVTVLPKGVASEGRPTWLEGGSFAGVVIDDGNLEIRSLSMAEQEECSVAVLLRVPLSESLAEQLSSAGGLEISRKPVLLHRYRVHENIVHKAEADFLPGSQRPVPVVVTARNWQTGLFEDWAVYQVHPSYLRTYRELSPLGARAESWVSLLGIVALALALLYLLGLRLSIRLSQRIVSVIDGLSHAALQVGKGDFSVKVASSRSRSIGDPGFVFQPYDERS